MIESQVFVGIYSIRNTVSGRVYVGSAVNITQRWHLHRSLLKRGKHHSILLQRSWVKHGPAVFSFDILELVDDKERLIEREQHWIDALNSANPSTGFNIAPKAGTSLGRKHPPEVLAKMRQPKKMPAKTPEHRAKISAAWMGNQFAKGKPKTPEARAKMSAAKKGKKCPWVAESNRRRGAAKHANQMEIPL